VLCCVLVSFDIGTIADASGKLHEATLFLCKSLRPMKWEAQAVIREPSPFDEKIDAR
jgi:hypothetical protein